LGKQKINTTQWKNVLPVKMLYKQLQYLSRDTVIADRLSHGFKIFKASELYGAFTFEMYNPGTLLGLFWCMAADFDQRIDNVFEGIDIIIKNYQFVFIGAVNLL
jgi:hypothetical protein